MRQTPDCSLCHIPLENRTAEECAECRAVCADMAYDEMRDEEVLA